MKKVLVIALALFLNCFLTIHAFGSPAQGEKPWVEQYLLLREFNKDQALAVLSKFHNTSSYLAWVLLERGRILYQEKRWPEFFGTAKFSRTLLPFARETEKLACLEILAMLRHCQWDLAKELVMKREDLGGNKRSRIYKLFSELLQISPNVPHDETRRGGANRRRDGDLWRPWSPFLWPVKGIDVSKLNPHQLRRNIVSQCRSKERDHAAPLR